MNVDQNMAMQLVERLGLPIVLVIAFIKGWIVPAYVYVQLQNSEKEFRAITLRNMELTERVVDQRQ